MRLFAVAALLLTVAALALAVAAGAFGGAGNRMPDLRAIGRPEPLPLPSTG
ncbi:MAG TPA: hypothetical protein VHZ77_03430 [Gaiellaceae bacterium]|nr:hypothetical protein [Gaiellaceae bacterium]